MLIWIWEEALAIPLKQNKFRNLSIVVLFSAPHKFYIGFRYVNPLTEDALEQMER